MTIVWEIRITVCQTSFVSVDQTGNALEMRIPALTVNVDVETMMNAPDLTFVYLVNAEVGTLKSLKRIKL